MTMKMLNNVDDYDLLNVLSDFYDMFDAFEMMNVIVSVDTLTLLIGLICSSCDMISNVNENEIDCLYVHVFDMPMVSLAILVVHLNALVFLDFV